MRIGGAFRYCLSGALLAAIGWANNGAVFAQAVAANDPAINPPPITLKLENASPQELGQALSTATGTVITGITAVGNGGGPGPPLPITINAVNEPFWRIYDKLHGNFGVTFELPRQGEGLELTAISGHMGPPMTANYWAGFLIYPLAIDRTMIANPQRPTTTAPPTTGISDELHLSFIAMADPRIKLATVSGVTFTSMIDNNGTDLLKGAKSSVVFGKVPPRDPGGTPLPVRQDASATSILQVTLTMPFPAKHGKTAIIKGEIRYQLQEEKARNVVVPVEFKDIPLPK